MDILQDAALVDLATVSFSVTPLASGYSRDVHGTVILLWWCKYGCDVDIKLTVVMLLFELALRVRS